METSSIKTPFPGRVSVPSSFVSLFIFYSLSYLPSKTMGCFSGRLMSSASDQKLFCEICAVFNCSFNDFVGEEVVSPSYSSAILAPPSNNLLFSSVFPSIRVFSNESALHIRWPKYWSFTFSINPFNEYSGLISFRIDWFDLLAVQGTLKSLLQPLS